MADYYCHLCNQRSSQYGHLDRKYGGYTCQLTDEEKARRTKADILENYQRATENLRVAQERFNAAQNIYQASITEV